MPSPKIATCCYCGTRAALILDKVRDQGRHELACASCGAPLHELKKLHPAPGHSGKSARGRTEPPGRGKTKKPKRGKKRKSPARKAVKGLFDLLDDIFD